MSFFTKPLSELITADIQSLLDQAAVENVRLEFKREVPGRDETLKKVSSFANTFGGSIVVGARADSADGRLLELSGVDAEDGFKQKIVQWCFDGASPPLMVEVSDPIEAPGGNRKVCYVIRTRESEIAPHFLNGRKGVYVRTDEFSARFEARLANEADLRHLLDRRRYVRERRANLAMRARKRFATYAQRKYAAAGDDQKLGSSLEICICPRFPAKPLCDQSALAQLVIHKPIGWRNTRFPRLKADPITQHESVILTEVAEDFSLFEANVWGMLFYATEIDRNARDEEGIHAYHFAGFILGALRHSAQMFRLLGYRGPVEINVWLTSILGVPWLTAPDDFLRSEGGSEFDNDVTLALTTSTDLMETNSGDVPKIILREAFFAANHASMVDDPTKLERLYKHAYEYNFW
jgi:hypothetical protein